MQDLKHLSRNKRAKGFSFFSPVKSNRRLQSVREPLRFTLPMPTGKRLEQLKLTLLFIAIVLGLTPVCVMVLRNAKSILPEVVKRINPEPEAAPKEAEPAAPAKPATPVSSFEIAGSLLEKAELKGNTLSAETSDGVRLNYTVRAGLQKRIRKLFANNEVPYAVFVAIEPATGRILGMTSYSSIDPAWNKSSFYGLYPMASLFKIITASAALEAGKINPATVVEFRGKFASENPGYWSTSPKGKNNSADVSDAMGNSINPVYGRIASDIVGKTTIMASVDRFGFNQDILPGIPVKPSQATTPSDEHGLMLMGAGLDHDVKISPIHAAVIMSAIANNGKMMAPGLTESTVNGDGVEENLFTPQEVRQLVNPDTAESLKQMLSGTVLTGTSRKIFHDKKGRPLLDVTIAAKTGSINGTDPKGHYSWFAAFAPIKNPRIALVALVINPDKWRIKASHVGEQALQEFFRK